MSQTTLTLGGVQFQDMEVPDEIPFGGAQAMVVHKLIGGDRVVDAMGRDDVDVEWSGRFMGSDALTRAQAIDAFRVAGQQVSLTWSQLSYQVVVEKFLPKYKADYWIEYSICCKVVQDQAQPNTPGASPSLDDQMSGDMGSATSLAGSIGDPTLTGQIGSLSSAMSGVPSFTNASQDVLQSVLTPLTDAQGQVSNLIGAASGTLGSDLGSDPVAIAANLSGQSSAMSSLTDLYAMSDVLSRMATNINAAGTGGNSQIMVGGDLGVVASDVYGDASAWTGIARANGLTDPVLAPQPQTIVIPPSPDGADGVYYP